MRNLTEISLRNKDLVWYFVAVTFIVGIWSYFQLGRMEDPAFTIRQMVVTAAWPGATAEQMAEQVADKLERKFQDLPGVDFIKSSTRAGTTVIYIALRQEIPAKDIRPTWRDLRNFGEDVKPELPQGVLGPYYNDRFDDVYGSIYAVTGDGYSYEELRQAAERARRLILSLDSVQKVELLGEQTERVYIEAKKEKLASLGISPEALAAAIQAQNQVAPSAMVETETDNVYLRVTGMFDDVETIKSTPVNAGGRVFRIGDVATVERRYADPASTKMYCNGKPAVGIAVSMEPGGNILKLGEDLNVLMERIKANEPLGMEISRVSDQPAVVRSSIDEFVSTLREAVVIVLVVSFLSLGLRTGAVVACCIPLVLAGTFCFMYLLGIDLHKVSLGSLIVSLGLLVDDAIIAVEMMSVKLGEGMSRFDAACYACKVNAKPMLAGTLITCAGFIPVSLSVGDSAEFCSTIFPIISIALLLSLVISIMVAPLFGTYLIHVDDKKKEQGNFVAYQKRFYQGFRRILFWCLTHRRTVLAGTVALFFVSLFLMGFVRQEYFPQSLRPEIIVEMRLPEGSSLLATDAEAARFAKFLDSEMNKIDNYSYYVGEGAPRFVLTWEPQAPASNLAQFVVVTKGADERKALTEKIRQVMAEDFPNTRPNIQYIQMGPPNNYPVMLRVSGDDKEKVKELAGRVVSLMRTDDNYVDINFDWNEKSKVVHLELDQDKMRVMGISSQQLAQSLYMEINGASVAQYYRGDRTIEIQFRLAETDRDALSKLPDVPIYLGAKGYVPLSQIAKISYDAEDGLIWRRDLKPTITIQANIRHGTDIDATQKIFDMTQELRDGLPLGYAIEQAGSLEESAKSQKFLAKPVPAMIFIIMTLLMIQIRNGKQMLMTLFTAPLGIIGVAIGMLMFNQAMGFVAILGVLSLSGMIIRNSVILISQIEQHLNEGETPWDAIIDSAILRYRPIMLTAATTVLGMVPLMPSVFWGPMATAIASGLVVATALTLLVLPTMYAAVYRVKREG